MAGRLRSFLVTHCRTPRIRRKLSTYDTPGVFFVIMVTASSQMSSRLGLNPLEVGLWASVGAISAWILGMLPAPLDPHAPEREAVEKLEQAVEKYREAPLPAVTQRHPAASALNAAWVALDDARVIRGGRVLNHSQSELISRALTAQTN